MPNRVRRKTASKVERAPFELGDHRVAAGRMVQLELPVARSLSGAMHSLPIAVLHGAQDGPVMWLSAAIHGDELNGIPTIRRVLGKIAPKSLRGTVLAVPTVNVFGLAAGSRYLPDRRDLNRSFPGSRRGSLAAQLAHLFMEQIVERSDVGIDLHTGAKGRTNLPQVRCDLSQEKTEAIARAFGAPVTVDASLRDGSLRAAASALGVPVLLYEGGEAGRFDETAIVAGVEGTMRVMRALRMVAEDETPPPETVVSRSTTWVRARSSGFCEMRVQLGERVQQGDVVAVVFDSLGKAESRVKATRTGIIIGRATAGTVHRGDAVAHIAVV